MQHRVSDVDCKTQLLALLAEADEGVLTDNARLDALTQHRVADVYCKTQLLTLLAGADRGVVADNVRRAALIIISSQALIAERRSLPTSQLLIKAL